MYDFTAGGLLQTVETERKTFLVDPKIDYDSSSIFAKDSPKKHKTSPGGARSDVLARWRGDRGPIGRAIRRGEFDILREAIREMKKRSI